MSSSNKSYVSSNKGQSYVINLKRRSDRKERFSQNYELYGPRIPLNFIDAIDGTDPKNVLEHSLLGHTSSENDYGDNPRIRATILSHMMAWSSIVESGEYGLIFEDDIIFREDGKFKRLWDKISKSWPSKFRNKKRKEYKTQSVQKSSIYTEPTIIYFGTGDFLPIHTEPPTEHLLRAQEKSHAKLLNNYFGKPNMKSAYIFNWFGTFSYILSPVTAQFLLDLSKEVPINKAVDVWIKEVFDAEINPLVKGSKIYRYITVPLLTYHSTYDLNVYDSDTWGISIPYDKTIDKPVKKKKITFIIPTRTIPEKEFKEMETTHKKEVEKLKDSSKNTERDPYKGFEKSKGKDLRCETLERTIESIISKTSGFLDVNFVIRYDEDDLDSDETIQEFVLKNPDINISATKGTTLGRLCLHKLYNEMAQDVVDNYNSDFIAVWDDDTIITTNGWDEKICNYYDTLLQDDPDGIACFQLRTKETWNFKNPILTSNFVKKVGSISTGPSVQGFIKYISYLARVNVFVRDIQIENVVSEKHFYNQDIRDSINDQFLKNKQTKLDIDEAVSQIVNAKNYKACGVWTKIPKDYYSEKTLETLVDTMFVFNQNTI